MEMNISQPDQNTATIEMIGQFWKNDELILFKKHIKELVDKRVNRIIIDLFRLSFISSQGLGLFVTTYSELKKKDCELVLNRPKGCVKEMIDLSGFDMFMKIDDTKE
jgi:anti-anti-sigma factor